MDKIKRERWKRKFGEWFSENIENAGIIDIRYPIKGTYVWLPYGFKLRKHLIDLLRRLHNETGHEETLFPLLIPEQEFMKEAKHVKGFENEVYWVTHGGIEELNVKLAIRPTSETAIYPMFALWIRSHKDMPLKIYQVVNVFRYETKSTKPLIRLREITTFKEAHTAHATKEDAEKQVKEAISIYKKFFDELGIPYIISKRPEWDKFPGAEYTTAFDTIMPDGKSLQIATVHNLAQNFSKTFEIKFEDVNGEQNYAYQTCYGISDRAIASHLALHGDDLGLCLSPEVAPFQIVVVPILYEGKEEAVNAHLKKVLKILENFRIHIDDRNETPGSKFYYWEKKGVPLRIEIGPKDAEANAVTVAIRSNGKKEQVKLEALSLHLKNTILEIKNTLRERAWSFLSEMTSSALSLEEAEKILKRKGGIIKTSWCGKKECAEKIENELNVRLLGINEEERKKGKCIACGEETESVLNIAKAY